MLKLVAIGSNMKDKREALKFRQQDLADLVDSLLENRNIDRPQISRIESGKMTIDSHTAVAISKVLDAKIGDLFIPEDAVDKINETN